MHCFTCALYFTLHTQSIVDSAAQCTTVAHCKVSCYVAQLNLQSPYSDHCTVDSAAQCTTVEHFTALHHLCYELQSPYIGPQWRIAQYPCDCKVSQCTIICSPLPSFAPHLSSAYCTLGSDPVSKWLPTFVQCMWQSFPPHSIHRHCFSLLFVTIHRCMQCNTLRQKWTQPGKSR